MLCLAVLYALLGAPFLAFVQVIVYTGAVLMLFLFVLMIVGHQRRRTPSWRRSGPAAGRRAGRDRPAGPALLTIGHAVIGPAPAGGGFRAANMNAIARLIFTTYVFPFEVTSALLITAALGAMVLAHRERAEPKPTQRDLSRLRMASGRPAPLPGPGTYARHNAVDMPALLPDGTPAQDSVSPFIGHRIQPRAVTAGDGPAGEAAAGPDAGARRCSAAARPAARKGIRMSPGALRGAGRDPVRDRRGGRAGPPQRHGHLHVRGAHAERGQPGLRGLRPAARQSRTARSSRSS